MPLVTPRPGDDRGEGGHNGPEDDNDIVVKDKNGKPIHFTIDIPNAGEK